MKNTSENNTGKSFGIFTSLHATSFNKQVVSWLYPTQKISLLQQSIANERSMQFKEVVIRMISKSCKGIIVEFDSKFGITTNLLRLEGYNTLALEKNMSNVRAAHAAGMQNIVHGDHTDLERVLNRFSSRQICAAVKFVHNENLEDLPAFLDNLIRFQKSGDKLVLPFVEPEAPAFSSNKNDEVLDSNRLRTLMTTILENHGYCIHNRYCDLNETGKISRVQCATNYLKALLKIISSIRSEAAETKGLQFSDSSLLIAEKM
ncbi:MAG: hypothetical protein GC193_12615 [Cryomorphaceae bacterium]|nr:hypothetical protein [Cryomorphaceae bacterium]